MRILYLSRASSKATFDYIFNSAQNPIGHESQKFHSLVIDGLNNQNEISEILSINILPINRNTHLFNFLFISSESNHKIKYKYAPYFKSNLLRSMGAFIYTFFLGTIWALTNVFRRKIIISDSLNFSIGITGMIIAKLFNVKIVSILTDLPENMTGLNYRSNLREVIYRNVNSFFLNKYHGYILITQKMKEKLKSKIEYIVMEGLVASSYQDISKPVQKSELRVILYTGAVFKKYGIENLIKSFLLLKEYDLQLLLLGPCDMITEINEYHKIDNRVVYGGVVPNEKVLELQKSASLLINPRPSNLEYTSYSFPSKTIEYLASGTPVLSTVLDGIPDEYWDYLIPISDESIDGINEALLTTLNLTSEKLNNIGKKSQEFILISKNNIIQAKRIVELCNKVLNK